MVMAYFYYRALGNTQLAAIGLLSFAAIAQLAPAFFGGLFWRRATARGAMGGMLIGVAVWVYTLFLPSFLETTTAGCCFCSTARSASRRCGRRRCSAPTCRRCCTACCGRLSLNILTYVVLSLARQPSSIERLQADLFVPNTLAPIDADLPALAHHGDRAGHPEHGGAISRPRTRPRNRSRPLPPAAASISIRRHPPISNCCSMPNT